LRPNLKEIAAAGTQSQLAKLGIATHVGLCMDSSSDL